MVEKAQNITALHNSISGLTLPPAAANLITKAFNKGVSDLKKVEMETRSTNVKEVTSYFKEAFRADLHKARLFEVIGWTLLAEIVLSRTSKDQYCTMIELSKIYPMGRESVKEEFKKRGIRKPRVPTYNMYDINHIIHDLGHSFIIVVRSFSKSIGQRTQNFCQPSTRRLNKKNFLFHLGSTKKPENFETSSLNPL